VATANIFASVPASKLLLTPPSDGTLGQFSAYATLALGSAFALFLYPHTKASLNKRRDRTASGQ
jgi:SSS family solute:Na+ symporter